MGWWKEFRRRHPGAPLRRLLLWELIRHLTFLYMVLAHRFRAWGQGNIPPESPVLLISNHQSYLDLLALGGALPHRHFHAMARKTLFRSRYFGGLIRGLNAFEVDQEKSDIRAVRTAIELLKSGELVLIFPEGSRTPDGRVHEFQEGLILLIRRARPVVVPAAIEGAFEAWPTGKPYPGPGHPVGLEIGQPIAADALLNMAPRQAIVHLRSAVEQLQHRLRARIGKAR